MSRTTHLLYLHGFRSSPRSAKAQIMARRVAGEHPAVHWWAPQLPPSPREAMDLVMAGIRDWPREAMAVVGSSLGGFYATHVAAATGCRAVLLNPAVHPARDLARYIGDQTQWHAPEEHFYFKAEYIDELKALETTALSELAGCGDEAALRAWNTRYFGDKGLMKAALGKIGTIPPADRKAYGQEANRIKVALEGAYESALSKAKEAALEASLTASPLDVTLPGRPRTRGRLHPATQILREIYAIFADMGFQVYRTREVETDLNNFEGTGTVAEGAREPVRLALLDEKGPTGTFSNHEGPIAW